MACKSADLPRYNGHGEMVEGTIMGYGDAFSFRSSGTPAPAKPAASATPPATPAAPASPAMPGDSFARRSSVVPNCEGCFDVVDRGGRGGRG